MSLAVQKLRETKALLDAAPPTDMIAVSREAYAAIVRASVRDPFERVKLLFNAGLRGAELRR